MKTAFTCVLVWPYSHTNTLEASGAANNAPIGPCPHVHKKHHAQDLFKMMPPPDNVDLFVDATYKTTFLHSSMCSCQPKKPCTGGKESFALKMHKCIRSGFVYGVCVYVCAICAVHFLKKKSCSLGFWLPRMETFLKFNFCFHQPVLFAVAHS